ncbi:polyphosphate kinase 1 [Shewanella waksmanii]|uniref:polyphosphate kinase 1 n=1 Tax=Shewanella waksmanii TaxID=213783 RepID=UPI0004B0D9F7|nr:polyphosphate kinase 1 [Shewanella waksmanii]
MSAINSDLLIDKELSWLSFNERVLQEACDTNVPLIERVRFLGIFSSNMDEFFKVRVAAVRREILLTAYADTPSRSQALMHSIQDKVLALQERFDATYHALMKDLVRANIYLINETQLSEFHHAWLKKYFKDRLVRHIAPLILTKQSELVNHINDDSTYLCAALYSGEKIRYAFVKIPDAGIPRFIELPHEKASKVRHFILVDNIIRHCLDELFEPFFDYDRSEVYSMKMTRDADFDITDELEKTQLEQMTNAIRKRLQAQPVRLVFDRNMPNHMLKMLKKNLHISSTECLIPGGRYHSFRDFMDFPTAGRKKLVNEKLPALNSEQFSAFNNSFDAIKHGDIVLNYPYHKFSHFTELVRQAAYDPAVTSIKINLYRVAKNSHIMQSLIDAVKNGKRVTAVIELRARFDEQSNIDWTKRLAEAGVKVHHGIPSLKVHSKLCLIAREEQGSTQLYAHIGTGNFNEGTARFYTDLSLFTADQAIAAEVQHVFELLKRPYQRDQFNHLIVSPFNSRQQWLQLIDDEIDAASRGEKSGITLKLNNLVDDIMVNKLYQASQAGVKIKLMIRGMCTLVPQIAGISDNIEVYSIVDRFLEHSRIMLFSAAGQNKLFMGSSDWMTRNLDERVEVCTPIYSAALKKMIMDLMQIQFSDNTKSRIVNQAQSNPYKSRGNKKKVRSQIAIHQYLTQYEIKQAQRFANNVTHSEGWHIESLQQKA